MDLPRGGSGRSPKAEDDPRSDAASMSDFAAMKAEGMPSDEIVDHVVVAYGPAVAALPKLGDADGDGLVRRFASHLVAVVHAPARAVVEDVVVDASVPPDLCSRIEAVAKRRKDTQDAFVLGALRAAVGSP